MLAKFLAVEELLNIRFDVSLALPTSGGRYAVYCDASRVGLGCVDATGECYCLCF